MSDEIEPHILKRYEIVSKIGKGAYGVVWKAIDKKCKNTYVALKKIFDAFQNATDAQRTFREIMFLYELDHQNIVKLYNVHRAENHKDIYLVFEHMETDLHGVIRAGILEEVHKQYIIYQILKSIKYMHSAELLHRDLKPSNILLDSDCSVKVADFGLVRSVACRQDAPSPVLTEYVATRWYRAPEILLGSHAYTKGVDMWSIGCILGELLTGKPIFPGNSTLNQLDRILQLTGWPSLEDVEAIQSPLASTMLGAISPPQVKPIHQIFPTASDDALDLIFSLLKFNPNSRLTAEKALAHPYFSNFHNVDEEPISDKIITLAIDDNEKFTANEYRDKLYEEIAIRKRYSIRNQEDFNSQLPSPPPVSDQLRERPQTQKVKPQQQQESEKFYDSFQQQDPANPLKQKISERSNSKKSKFLQSALNGFINPRQNSKTTKQFFQTQQQPNKTYAPSFPNNSSINFQKNVSYTQTETKVSSQLLYQQYHKLFSSAQGKLLVNQDSAQSQQKVKKGLSDLLGSNQSLNRQSQHKQKK
ncbi:unnamed protein product (macronuclear) [Paramecium tetraurelia]|uniref:Mitogen-activated protein kinase n=1 Tax=Paramecium tetraurelia TaxID=5888 RepID=A0CQJ6_PARTE|nr:uncharacterized protein GSPATT00009411001 [Paramecium tetraurelia]CAK73063.1 unnamed protein product [Paramecium tetraurelia]|eukprot:XP_001440460.1 hypothetical protein (macronuclear) [Paramecium tetraurelia strain d4-2]